jgi:hypothetical protein
MGIIMLMKNTVMKEPTQNKFTNDFRAVSLIKAACLCLNHALFLALQQGNM